LYIPTHTGLRSWTTTTTELGNEIIRYKFITNTHCNRENDNNFRGFPDQFFYLKKITLDFSRTYILGTQISKKLIRIVDSDDLHASDLNF